MKKLTTLFVALLMTMTLFAPSLCLTASAASAENHMRGVKPKVYNEAKTETMVGLPEGETAIVLNNTEAANAEMRYQLKTLPVNGQYLVSFWYKTNSEIANFRISYCGDGKSKPLGYKQLSVMLPNTEDTWKQFEMVMKTTDVVSVDGTYVMADAEGKAIPGTAYAGVYIRPMQAGTLSSGQYIYYTVPTVCPLTADITGKYEDVEYEVKDSYGSGEALYNFLGIRSEAGTAKTEAYDIKLAPVGTTDLYDPIPLPAEKLLPTYSENLVKDGGMENVDMKNSEEELGWVPQQGTKNWGEDKIAYIDTKYKHSGNSSVRIQQADGLTSPFVNQIIDVDAQTTYQLRAWTRQVGANIKKNQVLVKFEFFKYTEGENKYTSAGYLRMDQSSLSFVGAEAGWTQFEQTITTPPETQYMTIYLRMGFDGVAWFDDVELYKVSESTIAELKTDQIFYYPSAKSGAANLVLNSTTFPDFDTKTASVDFSLKYGDTVLSESKGVPFCDSTASFFFDPALIEETKQGEEAKEHIVESKLYQNGELLQTKTTRVYKYKRPDCIDEEGNYYNNDGTLFIPVVGYHVGEETAMPNGEYKDILDGGINVVQLGYTYAQKFLTDPQPLIDMLDKLDSWGMKAVVCLYGGMVWAAHPNNAEATKAVVSTLSGHNAVFGWAVQDEPSSQIPDYENAMIDCYTLVKQYDTTRPVYIMDTLKGYELRNSLYCDIYLDSAYPKSGDEPGNVTISESKIMDSSLGTRLANKPWYHVVQTFQYSTKYPWFPNLHELRSMLYASLMVNARGTGYYEVGGSLFTGEGIYQMPEIWENGLVEMVNSGEHDLMFDLLVYGDHPVFSREISREKQYHLALKDGDIYAVILNGAADGVSKEATVSVPAESFNGKATLATGTAKALFGCSDADVTLSADALSVKLPASGVAVIKISGTGVTAETLAANKFTDLADYAWASEQAELLARSGVVSPLINWYENNEFRPGQAITRGEFAYALINTLNIHYIDKEREYTPQFSDVNKDAFYAQAVQIGRRVGIFKGDGTGNFSPESPITRQELMTMVARGMLIRYGLDTAKSADLSVYSDSASIADWANNSISISVGNGLILGNADGTLNPLGNTTRAEAAVIMARILDVFPKAN